MDTHFRRDADIKPAPWTVVAEFANAFDAMDYRRIKGCDGYIITAGINLAFAVRIACEHPVKHIGVNAAGRPECSLCGQEITEPTFQLHALTPRGKSAIDELMRRLPHGSSSL